MDKTDNKQGVFQKSIKCKEIPMEECMKISNCFDCAGSSDVTKTREKRSEERKREDKQCY